MSLIRKFLESKKRILETEIYPSLYDTLKNILETEISNIRSENTFEEKKGLRFSVNRLFIQDRLLYEEKKYNDSMRELKIFNPQTNKIRYYKKIDENNETISERVFRARFYQKNEVWKLNDNFISMKLNDIVLYFNMTKNKIHISNKSKEIKNILNFNNNYHVNEIKTENTKHFSMLNGILELFKEKQSIERKEGSTLHTEYNDKDIGKIKISVNYNSTNYSFFNIKGEKVIEEEYQNGKKKFIKFYKNNVCRYEEVFERNDSNRYYYNEHGTLRVSNILNKENKERKIIYNPSETKNRDIKKQIKECFNLKFNILIAGKNLIIEPRMEMNYENKCGDRIHISSKDYLTESNINKLKLLIQENIEQNELNNKPLGIIDRVVRRIKMK